MDDEDIPALRHRPRSGSLSGPVHPAAPPFFGPFREQEREKNGTCCRVGLSFLVVFVAVMAGCIALLTKWFSIEHVPPSWIGAENGTVVLTHPLVTYVHAIGGTAAYLSLGLGVGALVYILAQLIQALLLKCAAGSQFVLHLYFVAGLLWAFTAIISHTVYYLTNGAYSLVDLPIYILDQVLGTPAEDGENLLPREGLAWIVGIIRAVRGYA